MKKLTGMLLAASLIALALPAKAEIFKNLKTTGELEVLSVFGKNVADASNSLSDDYRNTQTRLIFGLSFDLLDDVHSNVTLTKNNRYYGQINREKGYVTYSGMAYEYIPDSRGENLDDLINNIYVDEANVVVDNFLGLGNFKIGRQFYGDEGDLVVYYGPKHGAETLQIDSLDAMRLDFVSGNHTGHLVWGKSYSSYDTSIEYQLEDTHETFAGISDMYKFSDNLNVGGYVYNGRTGKDSVSLDGKNLWVVGAKAKGDILGINYYAEGAANCGKAEMVNGETTPKYTGYAMLAKLAYPVNLGAASVKPRFMFALGSGDSSGNDVSNQKEDSNFYGINSDFRPAEIFGNANDFLLYRYNSFNDYNTPNALSNLTVYNVGIDLTPAKLDKLSVSADAFKFKITSIDGGASHLGSEVDIKVKYKCSENLTVGITGAQFYPEEAVKNYIADGDQVNKISKVSTDFTLKF